MILKCLSLWQPYASLVVAGLKKFETRGWSTNYRGRLLIHAGKAVTPAGRTCWHSTQLYKRREFAAGDGREFISFDDLPFGAVVGEVQIVDCTPTIDLLERGAVSPLEFELGDFSPDRFGWACVSPVRYGIPVPARGQQGIFNLNTDNVPGLLAELGIAGGAIPRLLDEIAADHVANDHVDGQLAGA